VIRSGCLSFLFVLLISNAAEAQLCNGSLGDPVVNITFNNGTTADVPGYTYNSSQCPNDGFYTITSSSSGCFNGAFHTIPSDHSGGGNFLLVNASFTPGDFFVQSVTDLCANTTYEFAAWVMNVHIRNGIRPNLSFKIETPDGTVLQKFETGDIAQTSTPDWKQYGFYFTTPSTNSKIVLRITNNAPGGNGNDIAIDDITFRPCGAKITASVVGNTDTIDICEGNTEVFNFNGDVSSAYQSPAYQWQLSTDSGRVWRDIAGATSVTYTRLPTTPGRYCYRLAVLEEKDLGVLACRIASNTVVINVHPNPVISAGADRIMLAGDSITLSAKAEGEELTYSWSPDIFMNNAGSLTPVIKPTEDISYTLAAVSKFGCANQDETLVKVVADIFIPNAFTPNGDGKNDTWRIPFLDPVFGGEVTVFNRLGEVVYHTRAATVSWDGTIRGLPQPSGTYVYIVSIKNSSYRRSGTVTLIR
jgi:gliding motility-associated-like protein